MKSLFGNHLGKNGNAHFALMSSLLLSYLSRINPLTVFFPLRQALFEFDKLIHGGYILRYRWHPQVVRNRHWLQNRIVSWHQLCAAIARVGGKKGLTARNDSELEISNQCDPLHSIVIVYYNSALLQKDKTNRPPCFWIASDDDRPLFLNGHYTFMSEGKERDLDAIINGLTLCQSESRYSQMFAASR